ncbi:MAG: hypothetical protein R3D62_15290 [Xanthobacteraceae bacterium]
MAGELVQQNGKAQCGAVAKLDVDALDIDPAAESGKLTVQKAPQRRTALRVPCRQRVSMGEEMELCDERITPLRERRLRQAGRRQKPDGLQQIADPVIEFSYDLLLFVLDGSAHRDIVHRRQSESFVLSRHRVEGHFDGNFPALAVQPAQIHSDTHLAGSREQVEGLAMGDVSGTMTTRQQRLDALPNQIRTAVAEHAGQPIVERNDGALTIDDGDTVRQIFKKTELTRIRKKMLGHRSAGISK